jgi:hypothetical protein
MKAIYPHHHISRNELVPREHVLVSIPVQFFDLETVYVRHRSRPLQDISGYVHWLSIAWVGGFHGWVWGLLGAEDPVSAKGF